VRKKGTPEDLSVEELRRLLVEKRRSVRHERLERFRRTGRVVTLVPDADNASLESLHSSAVFQIDAASETSIKSRTRRFFDAILLLVEVGAVFGLVFVIFNGIEIMQELNRQVAEVLEVTVPTPTPLIRAVVLPSGHTPPDSPLGARPNDAEIPEHLRPLVQSLGNIPIPTQGPEHAQKIQISRINVFAPIVQGDGWEQLKKGVGQHIGSANPGENGNVVLTGHNDVFGEIFRHLDQLKQGDEVVLFTSQRSYTYIVTGQQIVDPYHVEVLAPTEQPTITLISCYPYMINNKRIVVTGLLHSSSR
jgi:sortase A